MATTTHDHDHGGGSGGGGNDDGNDGRDLIAELRAQHDRVRDLLARVRASTGEPRRAAFDELRALLSAHEAAERLVLRPVARLTAGRDEAAARDEEEAQLCRLLAELENHDPDGPAFEELLTGLERAVTAHTEHEEREEFPAVRAGRGDERLRRLGVALRLAMRLGPTHPHPETAWSEAARLLASPWQSAVDRARDAAAADRRS